MTTIDILIHDYNGHCNHNIHTQQPIPTFAQSHMQFPIDNSFPLLSSTKVNSHSKEMVDILFNRKESEQLHKAIWIHILDRR